MSGGAFSSPIVATLEGQKQLVVQTRQELAGVDMASGKVLWKQAVPAFRGMNILTPTVVDNKVFTSSYNNKSFGLRDFERRKFVCFISGVVHLHRKRTCRLP